MIHNLVYKGKYNPTLAASVDVRGKKIQVDVVNSRPIQSNKEWVNRVIVDCKNDVILWWDDSLFQINKISTGNVVS
jgi:hypothetical protein